MSTVLNVTYIQSFLILHVIICRLCHYLAFYCCCCK